MLFKTTEEIKQYLPANAAFKFEQIRPFIQFQIEPNIIVPVLGQAQYDALTAAYAVNTLSAAQKALLDKVRYPIANYAYVLYIPFAQVAISASGIHIEVSNERKTAFEWQINKLEESCLDAADNGIERLLEFMEANISDYPDWSGSSSYTVFKECFINTSRVFSSFFNIRESRRLFLAMKHTMKRVEDMRIKSLLCKAQYDEIKGQILSDSVTTENQALLDLIQPAVAHLTAARTMVELDVRVTPEGIFQQSTSDTLNARVKTPAEKERISALQRSAEADGENYLQQLRDFLYDNADTYPLWKTSSCYVDPDSDDAEPWDQSDNGIVSL